MSYFELTLQFRDVKYSPCGRFILASILYEDGVRIWNADSGEFIRNITQNSNDYLDNQIEFFDFNNNRNDLLAVAGINRYQDNTSAIRIFENTSGSVTECIRNLTENKVTSLYL